MSDEHHVCLGRKCYSPKMLWWNPVVVFIEAYSYLIETERKFLFSVQDGTGGKEQLEIFWGISVHRCWRICLVMQTQVSGCSSYKLHW